MGNIAVSRKTFDIQSGKLKAAEAREAKIEAELEALAKKLDADKAAHQVKLINELVTNLKMAKLMITSANDMASNIQASSTSLNEYMSSQLKKAEDDVNAAVGKIKTSLEDPKLDEGSKNLIKGQLAEVEELKKEFAESIKKDEAGQSTSDTVDVNEEAPKEGPTEAFGKRKRRRRFGSLYCPKAIKGAYGKGKKKPVKKRTTIKRRKPVKRRKTVKRRKPTKRRKTVKRRKTAKRRTTTKRRKRSTPNSLSGIFNVINPASINKILQENPDIMKKISDLKVLKEAGRFNSKELVVIAALSTLSEMSVEDASNQFMMLKSSGMSTDSIFDQAIGSTSMAPPAPKQSFLGGMLGGYGRKKVKKVKKVKKAKKVSKKPSAALKKLCKKHKVRLTVKRGGKRVYKSEKVLKKQCKTAMKKKK